MKKIVLASLLAFSCASSFADENCVSEAISAVKTSAHSTSLFESIEFLPAERNYLESYRVTLRDRNREPIKYESYNVTLMKSSCTVTSLLRDW